MIQILAFIDRNSGLIMAAMFALLALFILAGCDDPRPTPAPGPSITIEQAVKDKVEAEKKADAAIKTSDDAKKAAQDARNEAAAARALADEKDGEAKKYEKQAADLRTQEIAAQITRYSWWLVGVGAFAAIAAGFLLFYAPGNLAIAIEASGIGLTALGLFGLWAAPHWLALACGFAIVVCAGLVGVLIWEIRRHHDALHSLWDKTQDEAKADVKLAKVLKRAGVKL